jgi:hypothetical protein
VAERQSPVFIGEVITEMIRSENGIGFADAVGQPAQRRADDLRVWFAIALNFPPRKGD